MSVSDHEAKNRYRGRHYREDSNRVPGKKNQIANWVVAYRFQLFIATLLIIALILFLNPFPVLDALADRLPFKLGYRVSLLGRWLAYEGGALLLGIVFMSVGAFYSAFQWRRSVIYNQALWSQHCPQCGESDLRRVRRTGRDRLIGKLGFPVRRYYCPGCRWHGLRINESKI